MTSKHFPPAQMVVPCLPSLQLYGTLVWTRPWEQGTHSCPLCDTGSDFITLAFVFDFPLYFSSRHCFSEAHLPRLCHTGVRCFLKVTAWWKGLQNLSQPCEDLPLDVKVSLTADLFLWAVKLWIVWRRRRLVFLFHSVSHKKNRQRVQRGKHPWYKWFRRIIESLEFEGAHKDHLVQKK